jgi:mannose-6-phosphate isomerase-like protein (cupin superfamily)
MVEAEVGGRRMSGDSTEYREGRRNTTTTMRSAILCIDIMTHITLAEILEWEQSQDVYSFDVLTKEYFDVELKRYPPEREGNDADHTHDMDELYYVISGSGKASVGDTTYSIQEGEMIFVESGVSHEFFDREEEIIVLKVLAGTRTQTGDTDGGTL